MQLSNSLKTVAISKKRLGRGIGSGKGKTGGRGTKGQKARDNIRLGFIGGTLPLYKKLPYRRGIKNRKSLERLVVLDVGRLEVFKNKSTVDMQALIDQKLVSPKAEKRGVKIVGKGDLKKSLMVSLPVSAGAKESIEKGGGKVINV